MSLFSKIGKAIGKGAKAVGKVGGNVLKTAGAVASMVPGAGAIVGGIASVAGEILSPTKQDAIVQAVQRDGEIKVAKVEETIAKENPQLSAPQIAVVTKSAVQDLAVAVPNATINDKDAIVTEISFVDKATQFIKKYFIYIGLGVVVLLFTNKKNGKRSYRRY